jgi:hypothetical protein
MGDIAQRGTVTAVTAGGPPSQLETSRCPGQVIVEINAQQVSV